ncbi:LuxR family transcriptional regulator [Saccharothrix mutabilis subsp. mutabilis]|uniref:LuxR family transcriptional regulator n=1 Tax=Saccharothrix mutabilis subsp. mutabilis TaxID=66855 RepID=A0ABN0UGL6_9PSEU
MDLLGRDDLLATARAALARGGVVLHGPLGIGKSAVLEALLPHDAPVLRSAPARADRDVPYLVLADLLTSYPSTDAGTDPGTAGTDPGTAVDLPPPQRRALDRALRRRTGEPDPLALRQAVLTVLRARHPLVVLDNAQWVDPASAAVLTYATARAGTRLLVATRDPARWDGEAIEVPPLSTAATAELMSRHGHVDTHLAAGNPLYAIELAKSHGTISTRINHLVREQLDGQPTSTLLVAALLDRPTERLLVHCGQDHDLRDCPLTRVEADGEITFRHPLIPAALPEVLPPEEVRAAHARLADLVTDPVQRARHRAHAVTGFHEPTAVDLLRAAGTARRRGRPDQAAELGRLAADRTPPTPPARATGRKLRAARDALRAGCPDLATDLAREVLRSPDAPRPHRVRARLVMVDAVGYARTAVAAIMGEALTHARGDAALEAPAEYRFAVHSAAGGDFRTAARHLADAVLLARTAGDVPTEVMSLCSLTLCQAALGDTTAAGTLDLARRIAPERLVTAHVGTRWATARLDLFADRLDAAEEHLTALLDHAADRGTRSEVVGMTWAAVEVWVALGRCRQARHRAGEVLRLAEELGCDLAVAYYGAALAEAHGGDPAVADALARKGASRAEADGDHSFLARNLHVRGLAALTAGHPEQAVDPLHRAVELELGMGVVDPAVFAVRPDLAEALALSGRLPEAAGLIGGARACAVRLGRRGVVAALDRADGLLRLALRDHAGAEVSLKRAVEAHEDLGQPVQLGRSLLALAVAERRRRRRGSARRLLDRARLVFAGCGAPSWADRAAALLGDTPDGPTLTGFETRIARLVAGGASNPEVAARLTISVKTVEGALTRIYRKLDVHNRTHLAAKLTARERESPVSGSGVEPPP